MRHSTFFMLIVLSTCGCSDTKIDNSINEKPFGESELASFETFLDDVPIVELPHTIKCGFETTLYEKDFNNNYRHIIPSGFEAVGKIKSDWKDVHLILFASVGDILYPYLFSLDRDGNKIDSIYLHIGTCAGDENLELSTWSVIEYEGAISMTDTARWFNYVENDTGYSRTLDSTIITTRTVLLNDTGRFIVTSEEKETSIPN